MDILDKPPSKIQIIGILHLIGGIQNLILAFVWGMNGVLGITYIVGVAFCCPAILLVPIAILELISAAKHLSSNHAGLKEPRMTAIAEICAIMGCGTFSLIFGILTLVFLNDPEVSAYYRKKQLEG